MTAVQERGLVTSRFERTNSGLVQLTENNSQVGCAEGTRSVPIALVWHDSNYTARPDTIHLSGEHLGTTGGELIFGAESDPNAGSSYSYYSIITGRELFASQLPAMTFVANDTRRFLGVAGSWSKDTAASVFYSTGKSLIERLTIRRDSAMKSADFIAVDSMTLERPGPQCCNNNSSTRTGKDTMPVNGIALTFSLTNSDMDGSSGDVRRKYIVRVVNDRLVLDTVAKK